MSHFILARGADVVLLAHTDSLHNTLSGLATKKLMERAFELFRDVRYERLAGISVAHLYNLRQRESYQRRRQVWTKTRPVSIAIGERRAPAPNNQPGYLRLDCVHQGDQDGVKGVYHVNAVDCVTQYEGVATCERISEAFLIPVLEALLQSFPFKILGFQKWLRLFEQISPIYKWTPGGFRKVQSCPRRRASLATNAKPRWATRGAPGFSSYAAIFNCDKAFRYFSSGVSRSSLECGRCVLYHPK